MFTRHGTYHLNSPTHCHTPFVAQVFSITNSSGTQLTFPVIHCVDQSFQLIQYLIKSCFFSLKTFLNPISGRMNFWTEEQQGFKFELFNSIENSSCILMCIKRFARSVTQLFKCSKDFIKLTWNGIYCNSLRNPSSKRITLQYNTDKVF
jgi:hypothetical protein